MAEVLIKRVLRRFALIPAVLAFLMVLAACEPQTRAPASGQATRLADSGFPYDPLVYHLDLSILAYQLYGQTLVWPFDPYYESFARPRDARRTVLAKVQGWAASKGVEQAGARPALGGYRGPGSLAGFPDNPRHDPIIYRYDTLNPWRATVTGSDGRWVEYLTPKTITDKIRDVQICYRGNGRPEGEVTVERVASQRGSGRDVLLAFEGGTGDKGEAGQPHSQSLMGFVLLRHLSKGAGYDVHIAFRGSRSGSLQRAVRQAFSTKQAAGNPDWITDLGFDLVGPDIAGHISTTGRVHRGFARSLEATLPQVFACLSRAASLKAGQKPRNIYVTGHSLGGGLAQQFASAVLLGNRYTPDGATSVMQKSLRGWPWRQIKLVSFSAPRAGDPLWARTLTETGLASEFHSDDTRRYDYNALGPADPAISARLTDPAAPAGFRVLATTDPISTSLLPGRKPVGKTVYADGLGPLALVVPHNPASHEPGFVRDLMLAGLVDPRVPATAWRYLDLVRAPGTDDATGVEPYARLKSDLEAYHNARGTRQNRAELDADFRLLQSILNTE